MNSDLSSSKALVPRVNSLSPSVVNSQTTEEFI